MAEEKSKEQKKAQVVCDISDQIPDDKKIDRDDSIDQQIASQ